MTVAYHQMAEATRTVRPDRTVGDSEARDPRAIGGAPRHPLLHMRVAETARARNCEARVRLAREGPHVAAPARGSRSGNGRQESRNVCVESQGCPGSR